MIGGGGRKVLSVAARQADIVQLMPSNRGGGTGLDPSQFSAAAIEEKIGWIRDAAGARFDEIELSAQLLECVVTDRPEEHLADFADRIATVTERMGGARVDLGEDDLRKSPIVAVGSLDEVCERLVDTRDRYGITYFAAPIDAKPEVLAPVIEALAGADRHRQRRVIQPPSMRIVWPVIQSPAFEQSSRSVPTRSSGGPDGLPGMVAAIASRNGESFGSAT